MDTNLAAKFLFGSLMAVLLLQGGESATSCYSCATINIAGVSTADSNCDDTFANRNPSKVYVQPNCPYGCAKITFRANGADAIGRICAPSNCQDQSAYSQYGYSGTIHCCTGNKCNGSGNTRANVVLATIATGIAALIVYKF